MYRFSLRSRRRVSATKFTAEIVRDWAQDCQRQRRVLAVLVSYMHTLRHRSNAMLRCDFTIMMSRPPSAFAIYATLGRLSHHTFTTTKTPRKSIYYRCLPSTSERERTRVGRAQPPPPNSYIVHRTAKRVSDMTCFHSKYSFRQKL